MNKVVVIGSIAAVTLLAGVGFYFYEPPIPPPPKDAAANLPKEFRDRVTPEQLAMLRGERKSAPLVTASQAKMMAAGGKVESESVNESGLGVDLSGDARELQGKLSNQTEAEIPYVCSAGTLFSNETGEVVALRDVSATVPAKTILEIKIPVASTHSASPVTGRFKQQPGEKLEALLPLLSAVAAEESLSPGAVQTAVFAITENVPLDKVARFPSLFPNLSAGFDPKMPYLVANNDIIKALALLKAGGVDLQRIALMQDPQLQIMAMLDPESHDIARDFYGVAGQAEWSFWKNQLLAGDPALRHIALYGIARYYPEVAVVMLPNWVRATKLPRTYRVAAAGALGWVDDSRAAEELLKLKQEISDNSGVQQAIQRAIAH